MVSFHWTALTVSIALFPVASITIKRIEAASAPAPLIGILPSIPGFDPSLDSSDESQVGLYPSYQQSDLTFDTALALEGEHSQGRKRIEVLRDNKGEYKEHQTPPIADFALALESEHQQGRQRMVIVGDTNEGENEKHRKKHHDKKPPRHGHIGGPKTKKCH